jgi:serine/threonine-protein kinase
MASVWAARHRNGKRVAIKLLHPELTRDEYVRRRFLREGYVANKVKHPNVVTILDDDDDGEMVFLVMELLEGETLNERWKRSDKRLGLRFVLRVANEVLDVLVAAHAEGIIHRDIKPANVFVTTADELKVLDFGIARLHEGPSGTGHTTRLGAMMGSPSFMSPEQARARWEFVDARTDLWALGAMMFALLSGKTVHEGRNAAEVLIATATKTARSLHVVWPEAPDVVTGIVDRALAFERTERWQDARAMQTAVRRALQIDFDRPRKPVTSLADVSVEAPPSDSQENALFEAAPRPDESAALTAKATEVLEPPETAEARHDGAEPSPASSSAPGATPDEDGSGHTQATGLLPTLERSAPPSAPPSASAVGDSTTSPPVSAPLEPGISTIPAPAPRPLRPTVVLGMFIAGGLLAAGIAIGLLTRHPAPVVVLPPPVVAAPPPVPSPEPSPAPRAVEEPPAAPTATASASADAPATSAAPSAASASAAPRKKPPAWPRKQAPSKGRFVPKSL